MFLFFILFLYGYKFYMAIYIVMFSVFFLYKYKL